MLTGESLSRRFARISDELTMQPTDPWILNENGISNELTRTHACGDLELRAL
jgi:hypothetical protein